jgi:YfiH family protein
MTALRASDLIVPDWPAPRAVRAIITTRRGGVSAGGYASLNLGAHVGDDRASVSANRARLRDHVPAEPLWLSQVHGTTVVDAATAVEGEQADAAVAHRAGQVLAILTADCLPVLLCHTGGRAIGIAHAGWRGLAAGVIERTLERLGVPPGETLAYLGPGVGRRSYEVGAEVRDAFVRHDAQAEAAFVASRPGHFHADLYALARQRLQKQGIMAVLGGDCCTFTDKERFFSYRRDGETGRMASLIWLAN